MQIQPVTDERMTEMNVTFNLMALELLQRRKAMVQQDFQIKELEQKVAKAESSIVELEGKLDELKPVITKITRREITPDGPREELEEVEVKWLRKIYHQQREAQTGIMDTDDEVDNAGTQTQHNGSNKSSTGS